MHVLTFGKSTMCVHTVIGAGFGCVTVGEIGSIFPFKNGIPGSASVFTANSCLCNTKQSHKHKQTHQNDKSLHILLYIDPSSLSSLHKSPLALKLTNNKNQNTYVE